MRYHSIDSSAGHLAVRIDGRPEVAFQFARQPQRLTAAFLTSFTVQASILAILILSGGSKLQRFVVQPSNASPPTRVVFLPGLAGSGGGGGGGGNGMTEPPRLAGIPKPKLLAVMPLQQAQVETTPPPQFNIPVTTLATTELPGAMMAPANLLVSSQGLGSGGGGDKGKGLGIGVGDGPGFGPGSQGGMNGGPFAPGTGSVDPVPIYRAAPQYTSAAVTAHVSGEVWVECTVLPNGTCVGARVIRSLDPRFGLDQEALKAAERWRFWPGRDRDGRPVPFLVSIAVEFNLR